MPEQYYLDNRYLFWTQWKIVVYRFCFTLFYWLGLIISVIIALVMIKPYSYIAILTSFFFIFVIIRSRLADYPLSNKYLSQNKINLAWFLDFSALQSLVEARLSAYHFKIPLSISTLITLLDKPEIVSSLKYLDITPSNITIIRKRLLEDFQNKIEINNLKKNEYNFIFNLLLNSLSEAFILKHTSFNNYILFLGLFNLNDSLLNKVFDDLNINKSDVEIGITIHLLSRQKNIDLISGISDIRNPFINQRRIVKVNRSLTSAPTPTLDNFSIDYTDLAQKYRIGIMIGHIDEYKNLVTILSRPNKKCVLLIGKEGIGKETIISYLAYNLSRNEVPSNLLDFRLIKLLFTDLLQNVTTSFDVINRLTTIVQEILANHDIILYLADLHNYKLITQERGLSVLEILKPLINSGLPLIATSNLEDYKKYLEQDSFIQENFELIKVQEISEDEAIKILALKSISLERKYKISISYRAIKRAVLLAKRFLTTTPLPSSAEKLITEALEGVKTQRKNMLTEQDIVNLVMVKTNIPIELSSQEDKAKLLMLEKYLHENYVDQEEAVTLVSSAIRQYRAGLSNPNKPIGVFLFVGPTGVGKTELAKNLAQIYFGSTKTMIRFDMSEYQDIKSIVRFIGDPNGTTRGALTEAVKDNPFSLILLDEFEKANSKVLDLFLPIFDEGKLLDNMGDTIDFTNTIIIATSNALSDFIKNQIESAVAFTDLREELKKKLTNYFKPELINRFDEIVVFKPLTRDNLMKIVELKLKQLQNILKEKQIDLSWDNSCVEKIAQLGYDPIFGARPLDSVIRKFIKDPLANMILSEKIKKNSITISYTNNQFQFLIK